MDELISKAQLIAITVIFTAALLVSMLCQFRLVSTMAMDLVNNYDTAVTGKLEYTISNLETRKSVTFPEVFTAIEMCAEYITDVSITLKDGTTINCGISEADKYLLYYSSKSAKVSSASTAKGRYTLILTEV